MLQKEGVASLADFFEPSATIILTSCSTGKPGGPREIVEAQIRKPDACERTGNDTVNTGSAGVSPAMSAKREQLDHSTLSGDATCGRDARGPSE